MELTAPATPVALITGAGSGIGRAAAVLLAREGFHVALIGRREARLHETADHIAQVPGAPEPLVIAADVGDAAQAGTMISRTTGRFGRLDALINNAGIAPRLDIDRHTPEIIDEVFRINALGPAYAIAAAWPVFLRQKRGVIVNISTMGTIDPFPGFFAYASAKAAVNLMARCCANEGREHGIRAFAIAPGAVETEMLRSIFHESVVPREMCRSPEHVARVILACIRGERDAQNGETIPIEA